MRNKSHKFGCSFEYNVIGDSDVNWNTLTSGPAGQNYISFQNHLSSRHLFADFNFLLCWEKGYSIATSSLYCSSQKYTSTGLLPDFTNNYWCLTSSLSRSSFSGNSCYRKRVWILATIYSMSSFGSCSAIFIG